MPLRTTTGIPIIPRAADAFEAVAPRNALQVTRAEQRTDAWCYAACAKMAIEFVVGVSIDQCTIVEEIKMGNCCVNPDSPICSGSGVDEDDIGDIYDRHN